MSGSIGGIAMRAGGAISERGVLTAEATMAADGDGLVRLVGRLGPDVKVCVEMTSGLSPL